MSLNTLCQCVNDELTNCSLHQASHAATRSQLLKEQQKEGDQEADIRARLNKINQLEREHLKLTATQAIAEVCRSSGRHLLVL